MKSNHQVRPLAAPGLISYRARDKGMRDWTRSTPNPTILQVWNGRSYVPVATSEVTQ